MYSMWVDPLLEHTLISRTMFHKISSELCTIHIIEFTFHSLWLLTFKPLLSGMRISFLRTAFCTIAKAMFSVGSIFAWICWDYIE